MLSSKIIIIGALKIYSINFIQLWISAFVPLGTVWGKKIYVQLVYLRGNPRKHQWEKGRSESEKGRQLIKCL